MSEDQEIIEIKSEELTPSHLSRYCETTDKLQVLLDMDKNIWITEGVPVEDLSVPIPQIKFPNEPHVFMVHDLKVTDKTHDGITLHDVVVVAAHGYRDGNVWRFMNGQSVSKTVYAYNERAGKAGTPKIEFVLSCNKENNPDPSGIVIKDISENHIAQAVGEEVHLTLLDFYKNGRVVVSARVDGNFWGLDDLLVYKQVSVSPQVDQSLPK